MLCLLFYPYSGTSSDEMCNLYIMYYMEAKYAVSFMTCTQNVAPDMFRTIPAEANIPIAVKSDMVMMHGHHKGKRDNYVVLCSVFSLVVSLDYMINLKLF